MKIYGSAAELIGGTPLVRFSAFGKAAGAGAEILAKLEYLNPAGSAKDRVGKEMLDAALSSGRITKDSLIIEPTSGNTGIGIAAYAAQLGMKVIIVMPETMSLERRKLIAAYGAKLVLTDGSKGMAGSIEKANELAAANPGSFIPAQFDNPDNCAAHYKTTGPEIWADTDGTVDIFVAGIGTGGTITGTGRFLKEMNPNVKIVAVEPADSPLLSQGRAGAHGLQGIGANFVPKILDTDIYDEIITVTTEQAYAAARLTVKTQGILIGISSGAALHAAAELAKRHENSGKRIVVLLPDGGERYLSTSLFEEDEQ
ncbi:MAG: cysteine synthase A [Oscillospiraceae bacterium]|nr:cysteine synthase A [Oscillospiraceae bacterium]